MKNAEFLYGICCLIHSGCDWGRTCKRCGRMDVEHLLEIFHTKCNHYESICGTLDYRSSQWRSGSWEFFPSTSDGVSNRFQGVTSSKSKWSFFVSYYWIQVCHGTKPLTWDISRSCSCWFHSLMDTWLLTGHFYCYSYRYACTIKHFIKCSSNRLTGQTNAIRSFCAIWCVFMFWPKSKHHCTVFVHY